MSPLAHVPEAGPRAALPWLCLLLLSLTALPSVTPTAVAAPTTCATTDSSVNNAVLAGTAVPFPATVGSAQDCGWGCGDLGFPYYGYVSSTSTCTCYPYWNGQTSTTVSGAYGLSSACLPNPLTGVASITSSTCNTLPPDATPTATSAQDCAVQCTSYKYYQYSSAGSCECHSVYFSGTCPAGVTSVIAGSVASALPPPPGPAPPPPLPVVVFVKYIDYNNNYTEFWLCNLGSVTLKNVQLSCPTTLTSAGGITLTCVWNSLDPVCTGCQVPQSCPVFWVKSSPGPITTASAFFPINGLPLPSAPPPPPLTPPPPPLIPPSTGSSLIAVYPKIIDYAGNYSEFWLCNLGPCTVNNVQLSCPAGLTAASGITLTCIWYSLDPVCSGCNVPRTCWVFSVRSTFMPVPASAFAPLVSNPFAASTFTYIASSAPNNVINVTCTQTLVTLPTTSTGSIITKWKCGVVYTPTSGACIQNIVFAVTGFAAATNVAGINVMSGALTPGTYLCPNTAPFYVYFQIGPGVITWQLQSWTYR